MGGGAEGEVSEGMTKIQFELLHMFGAVMAASKVSASYLIARRFSMLHFIPQITHICIQNIWLRLPPN